MAAIAVGGQGIIAFAPRPGKGQGPNPAGVDKSPKFA